MSETTISTNGVECERNGYDAMGRRVWNWDGTTTNLFVWSGADLIAEVDSTGGLRRSYVYAGLDMPLAMTVYTGATPVTYFYLTDKMGTVHAVADETGNIVEQYRLDAWGPVLGVYDRDAQPLTESSIGNRLLAQGREYSWKTGFYYHRARWMDPTVGRWLSPDAIGIAGGLNLWEFTGNCPTTYSDAFGLCDSKTYTVYFDSQQGYHCALYLPRLNNPTQYYEIGYGPGGPWGRCKSAFDKGKTIVTPVNSRILSNTIPITVTSEQLKHIKYQTITYSEFLYLYGIRDCTDFAQSCLRSADINMPYRWPNRPNDIKWDVEYHNGLHRPIDRPHEVGLR